jgi:cell wall integrity and stress response component
MCTGGGQNAWSVSLDGLSDDVDTFGGSDSGSGASSTGGSSSSGTKTTASPSVITEAGQTIIVTAPGNSKATQSSSGGPSKAGIAAGVVAGVLAICAAVGGLFFFLRARKRKSVEEAYRRNAAINQFVQGGRKQTSEGSSASDSRLDPSIMVQRRMSDGSIADNQDYSRRILKV